MIEIDEEELNKYHEKLNKKTIPDEYKGGKRENVISWEEAFMLQAVVIAGRSKDPSSQVGACIVDESNHILSMGYNGTPKPWNDNQFPWGRKAESGNYTKYPYVIHAEMNALLNYEGEKRNLEGATVYVTLFPCSNCAKALAQAGVKKVIYLSDKYINTDDNTAAKICLEYCGIEYEQFNPELQKEFIVSLEPNKGIKEIKEEQSMKLELKKK